MHHLIVGYGYCGYHLACHLANKQQQVSTISRHIDKAFELPGVNHLCRDIAEPFIWEKSDTIIYYLIPPIGDQEKDNGLQQFLTNNLHSVTKVIYFGSSGVYGDHQGAWVDEDSHCNIHSLRQQRRLDAEKQWLSFCQQQSIPALMLRIAGIYGPDRIPLQAAIAQTPLIIPDQAPYTNHIYIGDLVNIVLQLVMKTNHTSIYNIADGNPTRIGALQQQVAEILHLNPAPYESFEDAWKKASPMKKEFMSASRRLSIQALNNSLQSSFHLTSLADAVHLSLRHQGY
ncbi:SDR family oxidoreductase [Legionella cardiaca]|uniref:SDR family oxidoreductase n=1 Tax=Legionella cardiaca TaxID=1071983 RepID=A0ABY8ANQ1_9GAMM|nr:SDR family oxidoreductase [Legionella cardiaca]WED42163.1 SDR family oxidoreductase [Legionella cardiaca]